jgi:uncharacterized iron-regulated protein
MHIYPYSFISKRVMPIFWLLACWLSLTLNATAQINGSAYKIYTASGKSISFERMVKALPPGSVICFGELHDDAIGHWIVLQIAKTLQEQHPEWLLSLEMFERDDQLVLDEYLSGLLPEKQFVKEAKLWNNYATDYKPLVMLAKQHGVPVIASNVPRRYANLVFRRGLAALDSLGAEAKTYMAPLPIPVDFTLPGYAAMIREMGEHGGGSAHWLAQAQAVKDATMAHAILQHKQPQQTVLHVNGAYHSQNKEGVVWYLLQAQPYLPIVTVQVVRQQTVGKLDPDHHNLADFLIVVPADMTRTFESSGF